ILMSMSETVNAPTLMTVPPKFKPAAVFPRDTAPVIRAAEQAAARGPAAVEEFWRAVRRTGTPVVEAAGSPGERTATFLWRGGDELADVILVADRSADARSFERNRMTRVPGSDIWHLTYRMRADWRCSYAVAPVPADGAPPPAGPAHEMARVRRARRRAGWTGTGWRTRRAAPPARSGCTPPPRNRRRAAGRSPCCWTARSGGRCRWPRCWTG